MFRNYFIVSKERDCKITVLGKKNGMLIQKHQFNKALFDEEVGEIYYCSERKVYCFDLNVESKYEPMPHFFHELIQTKKLNINFSFFSKLPGEQLFALLDPFLKQEEKYMYFVEGNFSKEPVLKTAFTENTLYSKKELIDILVNKLKIQAEPQLGENSINTLLKTINKTYDKSNIIITEILTIFTLEDFLY